MRFFEEERERKFEQQGRRKEEEREPVGVVIHNVLAVRRPKATIRPAGGRNCGSHSVVEPGHMQVTQQAVDGDVSAFCQPKGKIRPPVGRRCASFGIK